MYQFIVIRWGTCWGQRVIATPEVKNGKGNEKGRELKNGRQ